MVREQTPEVVLPVGPIHLIIQSLDLQPDLWGFLWVDGREQVFSAFHLEYSPGWSSAKHPCWWPAWQCWVSVDFDGADIFRTLLRNLPWGVVEHGKQP
jgi:hypothetical protein